MITVCLGMFIPIGRDLVLIPWYSLLILGGVAVYVAWQIRVRKGQGITSHMKVVMMGMRILSWCTFIVGGTSLFLVPTLMGALSLLCIHVLYAHREDTLFALERMYTRLVVEEE